MMSMIKGKQKNDKSETNHAYDTLVMVPYLRYSGKLYLCCVLTNCLHRVVLNIGFYIRQEGLLIVSTLAHY